MKHICRGIASTGLPPPWPREVPVTLEQALETFPVVLLQNHAFVRFLYHKVHVALGLGPKTS